MKKAILVLAGAAVALTSIPAPADAQRYGRAVCARWRHGYCIARHRMRPRMVRYRTGYVFGPGYAYTPYVALPHPYVVRYRLRPTYRYVYRDGYIYVVDPRTYAVVRVIVR